MEWRVRMALVDRLQIEPKGVGSMKLLIIDDEPTIVETVQTLWERPPLRFRR